MPIANRVREQMSRASWIRRMFEEGVRLRREHGADRVADLSLGNPQIEPPEAFKEALRAAAAAGGRGLHRYMPNVGLPEARAAVAAELTAISGMAVRSDDVVMSCGAAAALNVFLHAVLDPGDEVVILAPYFPEYVFYIENHGGVVRVAGTTARFELDLDQIEAVLSERTRAVIINSPNNPTGRTYTREALLGLADLLRRRAPQTYLLSDEPYRKLVFDGHSFAGVLGLYKRAVVVGSHSKDLAIPGERIGYLAFSPDLELDERAELVAAAGLVTRTLGFVNAPALMQRVVTGLQGLSVDPRLYQERRDILCAGLVEAGYRVEPPGGAFYLFLEVPGGDDVAFVRALSRRLVLTVPGRAFGGPGHIRISYCVDVEKIEQALPAFAAVLRELEGA